MAIDNGPKEFQFPGLFTVVGSGTTASTATGAFTANTIQTQNITVSGAAIGDLCLISLSADDKNVSVNAAVNAANTMTVVYAPENITATIGAHNIYWVVLRAQSGVL
jgi:hypothetical protein